MFVPSPRRRHPQAVVVAALLGGAFCAVAARPVLADDGGLPTGFVETTAARGLPSPTSFEIAPDGRIFVAAQDGRLLVVRDGRVLPEPAVRLEDVDGSGERGLLGLTLAPDFSRSGHVYLYHTARTPVPHNRLVRVTLEGDRAVPGSAVTLIDFEPLSDSTWHNGGAMHFGPDGKLYLATGDALRPDSSQSLADTFGKILRLNPDGTAPEDNPFYDRTTGLMRAIWCLGLRNPYTFSFQAGTGRMFINDVGQESWEEVNEGAAGANYGWPLTEGPTADPRFRAPVYAYGRAEGCAITGGVFYDPPAGATEAFPDEYRGRYFLIDYCTGISVLDPAAGTAKRFQRNQQYAVDVRVAPDGSLYSLSRDRSTLVRFRYLDPAVKAPRITQQPEPARAAAGRPARFTVSASAPPDAGPLSYRWQRNGEDVPGATGAAYEIKETSLSDSGAKFRCVVTNLAGSAVSDEAVLTVVAAGVPEPAITAPAGGATWAAGEKLVFAGAATDPEDGDLETARLTWRVDFHHDDHSHPFFPETAGVSGGEGFIPPEIETDDNVWFRIHLTATDRDGISTTVTRDVHPRKVKLTARTEPAGLPIRLDGQPRTGDTVEFNGVVGVRRGLSVPQALTQNGVSYSFRGWKDAPDARTDRTMVTPEEDAEYVAVYAPMPSRTFGPGLHLLASPLTYPDKDARAVFGLLEGTDEFAAFRSADWDPATGTYQVGESRSVRAGDAFFGVIRSGATAGIVQTPVALLAPGESRLAVLQEGWNLIGSPFDPALGDVPFAEAVRVVPAGGDPEGPGIPLAEAASRGLVRDILMTYEPDGPDSGQYVFSNSLRPWQGYWLRAYAPVALKFVAPADGAAPSAGEGGGARSRSAPVGAVAGGWSLQLAARQGDRRDDHNWLGVATGADDGFDRRFDDLEPPAAPTRSAGDAGVRLSFPASDAATRRMVALSRSIRSATGGAARPQSWEFTVAAPAEGGDVTLTWPNVSRLPRGVEPVLVDDATGRRVPMRSASSYRFTPAGGGTRSFRVEVPRRSSAPLSLLGVRTLLGAGERSSKSVGTMRFAFTATREADVEAAVERLGGGVVARLGVTRARSSESSVVVWDRRVSGGRSEGVGAASAAPAGPYVLRLTARDADGNVVTVRRPFLVVR